MSGYHPLEHADATYLAVVNLFHLIKVATFDIHHALKRLDLEGTYLLDLTDLAWVSDEIGIVN